MILKINGYLDKPIVDNSKITVVEEDARSLALNEVDLSKIKFVDCLNYVKESIKGDNRLGRIKSQGYIPLDARFMRAFLRLQRQQDYNILKWIDAVSNGKQISFSFDGSIFYNPNWLRKEYYYVSNYQEHSDEPSKYFSHHLYALDADPISNAIVLCL